MFYLSVLKVDIVFITGFFKNALRWTSEISPLLKFINIFTIGKLQGFNKTLCNEANKKGT